MDQHARLQESAPARHRTLPLAPLVTGAIAALLLIALGTVLAIEWGAARRNTLGLIDDNATELMGVIERGVRDSLYPAEAVLEAAAAQLEQGTLVAADRDRLAAYLRGALAGAPQLRFLSFVDPEMTETGVVQSADRLTKVRYRDLKDDAFARGVVEALAEQAGSVWGEPLRAPRDGVTYVNLRRVVRRDDALIGYLLAGVDIPRLSQLTEQLGNLYEGTAFILYGEDRILAHPALGKGLRRAFAEDPLVPVAGFEDPVVGGLASGRPIGGFPRLKGSGVELTAIPDADGDGEAIAAVRWLDGFGHPPWGVGVWFASLERNAELNRLREALLAGLGVVLLALLGAFLLGRRMAAPLRRVAGASERVAAFRLDEAEPLPRSPVKELDEQATAFNAMLRSLKAFSLYVPRTLVRQLVEGGIDETASTERELTVLFSDIAGFTAISEHMSARQVASFLNNYFRAMCACIEDEGGTVDKFLGDGIMAFWGAPDVQTDTQARACRAALAMAAKLAHKNARRRHAGIAPVRIRIGLHCGPLVVGNIGAPGRINYTVVGDAANVAQRLEQAGRDVPTSDDCVVLISEAVLRAAGPGFRAEPIGSLPVRGREAEVTAYRLLPSAAAYASTPSAVRT